MTLSLNCIDAGDPICTHMMYGETEEELIENAKKHGIEVPAIQKRHSKKKWPRTWNILEK